MVSGSETPPKANESSGSEEQLQAKEAENQRSRDEYEELINAWATDGAKRLIRIAEWKPGVGASDEFDMRPPKDQATAAFVGRLEKEIRAAIEAGPPPGMSKRQWERVQVAAKKQLAILDDHPDVFKDQGAKEVRVPRPRHPVLSYTNSPSGASARARVRLGRWPPAAG